MLEVKDVSISYDGRKVLDQISFSVKQGDIIGIVGRSGAGKTSLLKILAGLRDAEEGTVHFNGKRIVGPGLKLVPGYDDIQLVNQDFGLDTYHTVEENVREKMLHLPKNVQGPFIDELLDLMELQDLRKQQAWLLSGGEQQRLSIARALACEPQLLLLDEPFVHLDSRLRLRMTDYLLRLQEVRKMTLVLVSHNGEEMLSLANSIIYIKNGTIRRKADPHTFYYNYRSKEEGELFGWVNSWKSNDRTVHFRPDEFEIAENGAPDLQVEFRNALFSGGFYLNNFYTEQRKIVVLLHKDVLKDVRGINIRKKNQKT